jgi:hypothetical protein
MKATRQARPHASCQAASSPLQVLLLSAGVWSLFFDSCCLSNIEYLRDATGLDGSLLKAACRSSPWTALYRFFTTRDNTSTQHQTKFPLSSLITIIITITPSTRPLLLVLPSNTFHIFMETLTHSQNILKMPLLHRDHLIPFHPLLCPSFELSQCNSSLQCISDLSSI